MWRRVRLAPRRAPHPIPPVQLPSLLGRRPSRLLLLVSPLQLSYNPRLQRTAATHEVEAAAFAGWPTLCEVIVDPTDGIRCQIGGHMERLANSAKALSL